MGGAFSNSTERFLILCCPTEIVTEEVGEMINHHWSHSNLLLEVEPCSEYKTSGPMQCESFHG